MARGAPGPARAKAQLKRSDLVARLAAALGAQDKQAKVGSYYHEMERGLLPSEGVERQGAGRAGVDPRAER